MRFITTGFGYDSHRFLTDDELKAGKKDTDTDYIDPKKPLILGGETVKGFPPFKARSDGDVLIHAAVNALLSALGLDKARDIGTLFPNTDKANSNKSSKEFLLAANNLVNENGFQINDIKLTVKGKARVDLKKVRDNFAKWLGVGRETILIQGTSGEEMDAAGNGLGMEVFGICTLVNKKFAESCCQISSSCSHTQKQT